MAARSLTIRSKVTIATTAVLILAIVVVVLSAAGLLRRALESDARTTLSGRIAEVRVLVAQGRLTPVLPTSARLAGLIQVVDARGVVVAATAGAEAGGTVDLVVLPAPGQDEMDTLVVEGPAVGRQSGAQYLVAAETTEADGGPLTIYAATTLDAVRAERYLRGGLLVSLPVLIALAALLIFQVVKRALAPVDAMRADVDRIGATDLSGRVPVVPGDDEVARLGHTLNRMLDRLEDGAHRQQLFAAAASHELRSPLSALRTELEVGLAYPHHTAWPEVAAEALLEVARLEDLARDLRVLTRPAANPAAATTFDLAELVGEEVGRRPPRSGTGYRTTLATGLVRADREAVLRVVRNLLDNADRHARSVVEVATTPTEGGTALVVANDGEPIAEADRQRIFEPFERLDEARALDTGGSGLGLAIARTAMVASGGSLQVDGGGPGTRLVAWFPPAEVPEG